MAPLYRYFKESIERVQWYLKDPNLIQPSLNPLWTLSEPPLNLWHFRELKKSETGLVLTFFDNKFNCQNTRNALPLFLKILFWLSDVWNFRLVSGTERISIFTGWLWFLGLAISISWKKDSSNNKMNEMRDMEIARPNRNDIYV